MRTDTLMIQGTTSDAGKSTLVAGLCRLLKRRGIKVAPFKPQNMALNSAVTSDGGEIGRAQALQAIAAGIAPHSDMNPVLLKPSSDTGAQVIIQGQARLTLSAADYQAYKPRAMQAVLASFERLQRQYSHVIVEGAGSPAEINLRAHDIANMGFAEAVDSPVILVADIDRGGVFAHLVGTLELLSATEQAHVCGFIINRFRGDIGLLQSGLDWLEQRTGKPVLGVVPYLHGLHLDAEDALPRDQQLDGSARLKIIVPALPRISNATDFDPLRLHPQLDFRFIAPNEPIPGADLIILPGSKAVQQDLAWLRSQGWEAAIHKHLRYGGKLIGICGGLQMLGRQLHDPQGLEGRPGSMAGLGLLDFDTTLERHKILRNVRGQLQLAGARAAVHGYEIHQGVSSGPALAQAAIVLDDGPLDGAGSADAQILASYVHGLFDARAAQALLLDWAGAGSDITPLDVAAQRETQLERLADTLAAHVDMESIAALLALDASAPPAAAAAPG